MHQIRGEVETDGDHALIIFYIVSAFSTSSRMVYPVRLVDAPTYSRSARNPFCSHGVLVLLLISLWQLGLETFDITHVHIIFSIRGIL